MAMYVKVGGAWKAVSAISIRKAGAWKLATGIGIKKDGLWKEAFGTITPSTGALEASVSPDTLTGGCAGAATATSNAAVVTASGGTGPYTYAWTKISGATLTITSPTAASTTFSKALANEEVANAAYKCTITDALAATYEVEVEITLTSTFVEPLVVTINQLTGPVTTGGFGSYTTTWTFNVSVVGGNGSNTYSWTPTNVTGAPFGYSSSGSTTASYYLQVLTSTPPNFAADLVVTVTDTAGNSDNDTKHVTAP